MAKTTKKKPLTLKEKRYRADIKKELQAEGRLPPDKPRLNRKKFAKEVFAEYQATMTDYDAIHCLHKAIGCMVGPDMQNVTEEEVGVLKMLKIAVETKKFMQALSAKDQDTYTIGEYLDEVVRPILKL